MKLATIRKKTQAFRVELDRKVLQAGVAAATVLGPAAAFAADDAYDPTADVVKIGLAVAAAIALSIAMTTGIVGIKSSKLPRRGM